MIEIQLKTQGRFKNQQQKQYQLINTNKSGSQILFLNFLKFLGIIYLIISISMLPIFIGIIQLQISYWKISSKSTIQDYLTIGTIIVLQRNRQLLKQQQKLGINQIFSTDQQKMLIKINNQQISSISSLKYVESFIFFGKQMSIQEFDKIYLIYDLVIQFMIIIGTIFLQHRSYKMKKKLKWAHIQNYAVEINKIPNIPIYQLIIKLKQYLQQQVIKKYGIILNKLEIFDIQASYPQGQYQYQILIQKYQKMLKNYQNSSQEQKKKLIKLLNNLKIQIQQCLENPKPQQISSVWVILNTRQQRYFVLQTFKTNFGLFQFSNLSRKFEGSTIEVHKAPNPQQIIWQNFYTKPFRRLFFRFLSLIFVTTLIILFDLLILFVQKNSPWFYLTSLIVLVLQIVLKQLIILISTFQNHKLRSRMDLSTMRKLTIMLYINTGILIFFSSFNFGDNIFFNFFSTGKYSQLNQDWYKSVGVTLMLSFIIQIIYINIRIYLDCFKKSLINFISTYFGNLIDGFNLYRANYQKVQTQLGICYGHLLSVLLIGHTYSYCHPIFYLFMMILIFTTYCTHSRFIKFYTQCSPYNNDKLDDSAIRFIFKGVLIHLLFVGLIEKFFPALISFFIMTILYIIRQFLFRNLTKLLRRFQGPFLKNTILYQMQQKQLINLLSQSNIKSKIKHLQNKINYLKKNQVISDSKQENFIKIYQSWLKDKINKLNLTKVNEKNQIQGNINYSTNLIKNEIF